MSDRVAIVLTKLESQKADLLSGLENWPREKKQYQPSPQDWSALQIIDHLIKTEVEIMAAARKGLARPHRIGFIDRFRTRFL